MLEAIRGSGLQGVEVGSWSHKSLRWARSWRGRWAGERRAGLSVSVALGDAALRREWQRAPGCATEPRTAPSSGEVRAVCPVPGHTTPGLGLPRELLPLNPAGEEPGQPARHGLLPVPGCHADFYGQ